MDFKRIVISASVVLAAMFPVASQALVPMNDNQLSSINGTGIAMAMQDIRITASPTSFLQFTGANPPAGSVYSRTDIRWYGLSITGSAAGSGSTWSGTCGAGILNLGCPRGGYDTYFAPFDNPLVLRAFDYTWPGFHLNAGVGVSELNHTQTILELLYPTKSEPYRFAFWGEANVMDNSGNSLQKLQMQNIWNNVDQNGSSIRLFQFLGANGKYSLGLNYTNYFSADIRMSVNQSLASPDTVHTVPEFTDNEGAYIGNYRLYFPMGQLFYQTTVISATPCNYSGGACDANAGNVVIEQTAIPNDPTIYNDFYGRTINDDPTGGYDRTKDNSYIGNDGNPSYARTHGYLRMGDWVATFNYSTYASAGTLWGTTTEVAGGGCMPDKTTCTQNPYYDSTNGLFFRVADGATFTVNKVPSYMSTNGDGSTNQSGGGTPVTIQASNAANQGIINLGDAQISGMLTQHLRITNCGDLSDAGCSAL